MRAPLLFLILGLLSLAGCERPSARVSAIPLPQDVYVWQRAHTAAVAASIRNHAAEFHTTVALVAEVSWRKSSATSVPVPQVTRVTVDWPALAAAPRVGLALRINAYPGPFAQDDATTRALVALARELLAEAAAHGMRPEEFQVDFDAATAKLAGYREWLLALRTAVAPAPLVFTALPAWLRSGDFPALARATGSYVLQVHSLARPAHVDAPATLCDPAEARAAIEHAAYVGVPFRVALPTYGYQLMFDRLGRFIGLSAEGPLPVMMDVRLRELAADPAALASLVRTLDADRPAALTGIIWYRLPVEGDHLNWSWPAFSAVRAGRAPAAQLAAEPQVDARGLIELVLFNRGDGDFAGPVRLAARWSDARRLGADAQAGFAIAAEDATALHLAATGVRLRAGERRTVGWLRLSPSTVSADVFLEK